MLQANQGHSSHGDVELPEAESPNMLYHGIADRFVIPSRLRNCSPKAACTSFSRYRNIRKGGTSAWENAICLVDTGQMRRNGYPFYRSVNGAWLTKSVPFQYLQCSEGINTLSAAFFHENMLQIR